jgi:hypothetical protein
MSKFTQRYQTDKNLEENGVEVELDEGVSITFRRISSEKSREVRRRLENPYKRQIRTNTLSTKVQEDLLLKQLAEGVLINWKGVTDAEGNDLPFSPENALKVFKDFPDFLNDVATAVQERDFFKKEDLEADVKN